MCLNLECKFIKIFDKKALKEIISKNKDKKVYVYVIFIGKNCVK